jgi:hypothetical protein
VRADPRALAGPVLLALVLTGCSSSSAKTPVAGGASPSQEPTAAATSSTTATSAPTAGGTPAPTAGRAAVTSAPTASAGAPTPRTTPTATASRAPLGTAPGTYHYDTSGTVTVFGRTQDAAGATTLTVGALSGGSQHTSMKSSNSTTDEQLVPRADGTFVSDLKISAPPVIDVEFALAPPALLVPTTATRGKTWTWTATSTDGKTTATQTSTVQGTETLTVGGAKVATVVVRTQLTLKGGVNYSADVTTWFSPAYRLVVKDHTIGQGTSGFGPYKNDVTDVLLSVQPA